MNTSTRTLLSLALLAPGLAIAQPESKARPGRPGVGGGLAEESEALKVYDKNGNHKIDADELPAMQQAFAAMKSLDKNANGEIEASELEPSRSAAAGPVRSRAAEAMKRVDKNGNRKIDTDEIPALEQMLAKVPEMMKRLDQNGDGKLDESEVARLNDRISSFGAGEGTGVRRPRAGSSGSASFRRPPDKSPETPKPSAGETIKPAEKPADASKTTPATDAKPFKAETPPNKFGS